VLFHPNLDRRRLEMPQVLISDIEHHDALHRVT
jgi:hypothetical protein